MVGGGRKGGRGGVVVGVSGIVGKEGRLVPPDFQGNSDFYVTLLKAEPSEEAVLGPQNILITPAILWCYYHNYPLAPQRFN